MQKLLFASATFWSAPYRPVYKCGNSIAARTGGERRGQSVHFWRAWSRHCPARINKWFPARTWARDSPPRGSPVARMHAHKKTPSAWAADQRLWLIACATRMLVSVCDHVDRATLQIFPVGGFCVCACCEYLQTFVMRATSEEETKQNKKARLISPWEPPSGSRVGDYYFVSTMKCCVCKAQHIYSEYERDWLHVRTQYEIFERIYPGLGFTSFFQLGKLVRSKKRVSSRRNVKSCKKYIWTTASTRSTFCLSMNCFLRFLK